MSGISDLGQRVADLYKEIVTTAVRFESLNRETTSVITEVRTAVQRFDERMQQMHLDHSANARSSPARSRPWTRG
jgi:hypothetical protein